VLALITYTAPEPVPAIRLQTQTMLRAAAAIALLGMAMHYLVTGRKEADVSRMILGALLALASLVVL
jgi:hypothetical protein